MTRRPAALAGVALSALLLSGCASDPRTELRSLVETITAEANDRDAAGVRSAVEDLLRRLDEAVRAGDLTEAEAATVRERALAVQAARRSSAARRSAAACSASRAARSASACCSASRARCSASRRARTSGSISSAGSR